MSASIDTYASEVAAALRENIFTSHYRDVRDDPARYLADFMRHRSRDERKIFLIGNGGSAAVSAHTALDFCNAGIRAVSLTEPATLTCLANDHGYQSVFARQMSWHVKPCDVLVARSSSGRSNNILSAVQVAREIGADVVTLSGFSPHNPLRRLGDFNFYVPSDTYGVVEIAHWAILHAIADEAAALGREETVVSSVTHLGKKLTPLVDVKDGLGH